MVWSGRTAARVMADGVLKIVVAKMLNVLCRVACCGCKIKQHIHCQDLGGEERVERQPGEVLGITWNLETKEAGGNFK